MIQQRAGEWLLKQLNQMKTPDEPIHLNKATVLGHGGENFEDDSDRQRCDRVFDKRVVFLKTFPTKLKKKDKNSLIVSFSSEHPAGLDPINGRNIRVFTFFRC